ncbi:MAG: caspase family protein [Bacteroidetes bacterium]|nr:caspase family protein [Bacteroidota bacterium]
MKKLLSVLLLIMLSSALFTSCDLFHTTNTTRGNSYALIYGVADYSPMLKSLKYADNDAEDMEKFFIKQGFQPPIVKYNRNATKSAIFADIESLRINSEVDKNTVTVFFFAGHGDGYWREYPTYYSSLESPFIDEPEDYSDQTSLIPYLSEIDSSGVIYATELLDKLNTIPGKKLVILDICHAGGFVPENGVDVDGLPGDYGYTGDPALFFQTWEKYFTEDSNTEYQDIWVIGSAGKNESAYEDSSVENGFFTYYLLQSLGYNHDNNTISEIVPADRNSDNLITVSEIYHETFNQFEQNYNNNSSIKEYYSHTSGGPSDLILLDISR